MNYSFEELNPGEVTLVIPAGVVHLSKLTLAHQVYFQEKYLGLEKIFEVIKEKPLSLIEIIWTLVKNKSSFNYKYTEFYNFFTSKNIKLAAEKGYDALVKSISNSQPLIKNQDRYKEILKIRKAQSDDQSTITCYGEIFDKFAARYGMSMDEFYNLTLRQVHILLQKMDDGKYKELEVQAALLGKKLQPRITYADISEEEEASNEAQAQEALKRLQQEYLKNQKENANG